MTAKSLHWLQITTIRCYILNGFYKINVKYNVIKRIILATFLMFWLTLIHISFLHICWLVNIQTGSIVRVKIWCFFSFNMITSILLLVLNDSFNYVFVINSFLLLILMLNNGTQKQWWVEWNAVYWLRSKVYVITVWNIKCLSFYYDIIKHG